MRQSDDKNLTEWVARLPAVVSAINNAVTRLIGKKLAEAIKTQAVFPSPQQNTRDQLD